jgi:multidrug efflux pump subunit AcrA (membrane-fusion protein)
MEEPVQSNQKHSAAINEIIASPPKWLLRWGITLFVVLFCIICIVSALVRYPESLTARATILDSKYKQVTTAPATGLLIKVFVKNKSQVYKNQLIMLIEDVPGHYLKISAPSAGKLNFIGLPIENTRVESEDVLFVINIRPDSLFYGIIPFSQKLSGKILKGQHVFVTADIYPAEQYGVITGNIDSISDSPGKDGRFLARIAIKNNFNKSIKLSSGLSADVKIITGDRPLIYKLMGKMYEY